MPRLFILFGQETDRDGCYVKSIVLDGPAQVKQKKVLLVYLHVLSIYINFLYPGDSYPSRIY